MTSVKPVEPGHLYTSELFHPGRPRNGLLNAPPGVGQHTDRRAPDPDR